MHRSQKDIWEKIQSCFNPDLRKTGFYTFTSSGIFLWEESYFRSGDN